MVRGRGTVTRLGAGRRRLDQRHPRAGGPDARRRRSWPWRRAPTTSAEPARRRDGRPRSWPTTSCRPAPTSSSWPPRRPATPSTPCGPWRPARPCVVEKPLCTTLADADRLVRVVEAGGVLTYAENLLFADATASALTEIAQLGSLHAPERPGAPAPPDLGRLHPAPLGRRRALRPRRPPPGPACCGRRGPRRWRCRRRSGPAPTSRSRTTPRCGSRFDSGLVADVEVSWRDPLPCGTCRRRRTPGSSASTSSPRWPSSATASPSPLPPLPDRDQEDAPPPQLDQLGYVEQLREAEAAWRSGRAY